MKARGVDWRGKKRTSGGHDDSARKEEEEEEALSEPPLSHKPQSRFRSDTQTTCLEVSMGQSIHRRLSRMLWACGMQVKEKSGMQKEEEKGKKRGCQLRRPVEDIWYGANNELERAARGARCGPPFGHLGPINHVAWNGDR